MNADAKRLCERFNASSYYRLLGLHAESDQPGRSRVRLPHSRELLQLYGGVHGGAIMSLADAAISVAISTLLEPGEAIATVDLSIQFIAPAGENDVVAEGEVVKRGRRLCFGACRMSADGRDVARAQGTWYVGAEKKIDRSADG